VYDFNRGFGKFRGFDEVQGFQGDIVYDQPQSVRHYGDNTLLQSPITPDNNIPKVAGQLNNSLTGQHYVQHYADDAVETGFGGTEQPKSLLEKAAIGALGVGAVAAGVYGAQKLTGRDLGVGRVGGMVRDLGQRAKAGIKSALGIAQEAAEPSFVTREAAENVLSVAQHGVSAIDDTAPGVVRAQNVVPAEVRVNQSLKSRIPDPWGESALGGAGQTMVAPAEQSVIGTQTSVTSVDPDIQSRIGQFKTKHASLFGVPNVPYSYEGAPYSQQTFYGPTRITPVLGQADEAYANLVRSAGPPRKTVLSGIDPQTKKPYSATVLRSELMGSGQPLVTVPGKVGSVAASSPVPERPSILGSYPGPEGSSGQGVQFTALQGMFGGQPYRYSILPTERRIGETITEFVQRPVQIDGRWSTQYDPVSVFQSPIENEGIDTLNRLKGLLAPQRPLRPGALSEVQRTFSSDPRAATVQKQAEAIFQATGDPSVIRSAYGAAPGLPIRVTLPSGESVPTGSLYEAFGQVVNPETGIPITTSRAESLQAALNMQSQMRERALNQLGLPSSFELSQKQIDVGGGVLVPSTETIQQRRALLSQLDPSTKKLLGETAAAVEANRAALAQAEANPLLYKLKPEITQGIREVPLISETSGEVVGSRVVPETEGLPTSQYYKMRAAGGAGRQEAGGIGRRREAVESMEGLGFNVAPGSMEDVSPVLYQVIDDTTGQTVVVQPHEVSPMQLLSGAAKPVRGTAVEPQRIMGTEGRSYKGVQSNVVDPGSFDPAMLSQIAEVSPERIDPTTGLAYSVQAMGGKERAGMAAEQEALRQAGRYKESIQLGKKMAQSQTQRVLPGAQEGPIFTGMSNEQLNETILQARNAGALDVEQAAQNVLSARAEQAEKVGLMKQRSELVKQALSGPLGKLPQPSTSRVKQPPSPPARTPEPSATIRTTREFVPTQLAIPGAGVAPAIQSNPALETAIATERYMGTRPSQKMRAALQQAMARAAVQQPTLF
jgi:hypothetical protein